MARRPPGFVEGQTAARDLIRSRHEDRRVLRMTHALGSEEMSRRLDWEAAGKRDHIRDRGSVRAEPEHRERSLYRGSRWNTKCRLCARPVAKGAEYYSLRPGVLCPVCAGALLRSGLLPADPWMPKGRKRLDAARRRIVAGEVAPPKGLYQAQSRPSQRKAASDLLRVPELTLKERLVAQQERQRASREAQKARSEAKASVRPPASAARRRRKAKSKARRPRR